MRKLSAGHRPVPPFGNDLLDPVDRLEFERLLQWLRLSFFAAPVLVLLAFGAEALRFAVLIIIATAASYLWVEVLLRRRPTVLLRYQLVLRLLDAGLVGLVLTNYHGFLGNAYYDFVYVLLIVAAAATHGQRGAVLLAATSGAAVFSSRLMLIASGRFIFTWRHITDALFLAIFFTVMALAVAGLMRRSGEVVARRDEAWRREMEAHSHELEKTAVARDQALAEAEAALQTRDEVISLVSHDLRNPLTNIVGTSQNLRVQLDRHGAVPPDRLKVALERIDTASKKMLRLLEELLDAGRVRAGQPLDLHKVQTDLVAVAQRAVAAYQAGPSAHRLRLSVPPAPLVGYWDPDRLERVVDNLISNAIKYSPAGGAIEIDVEQEVRPAGTWAVLRVRDQGLGIPAESLPRIFDRYYRGPNTAGLGTGTGLGLAAARQIIEQHGGTISVESREGQGSTFTLYLPLDRATSNGVS